MTARIPRPGSTGGAFLSRATSVWQSCFFIRSCIPTPRKSRSCPRRRSTGRIPAEAKPAWPGGFAPRRRASNDRASGANRRAPMRTQATCSHGMAGDQMMCQGLPAMPRRFQPQLNGSDRLCSTNVIIDSDGGQGKGDPAGQSDGNQCRARYPKLNLRRQGRLCPSQSRPSSADTTGAAALPGIPPTPTSGIDRKRSPVSFVDDVDPIPNRGPTRPG